MCMCVANGQMWWRRMRYLVAVIQHTLRTSDKEEAPQSGGSDKNTVSHARARGLSVFYVCLVYGISLHCVSLYRMCVSVALSRKSRPPHLSSISSCMRV